MAGWEQAAVEWGGVTALWSSLVWSHTRRIPAGQVALSMLCTKQPERQAWWQCLRPGWPCACSASAEHASRCAGRGRGGGRRCVRGPVAGRVHRPHLCGCVGLLRQPGHAAAAAHPAVAHLGTTVSAQLPHVGNSADVVQCRLARAAALASSIHRLPLPAPHPSRPQAPSTLRTACGW